ncbi:MAG: MBL fold metallo-hydrolase [Deltaproteobacteria bacterium]|nr:MBL fold metallo-hydrolase [Deltaproteobacteria bacterium]
MLEEILQGLRWLGHDGFAVTGTGQTVVFDPYQVAVPLSADVVLVTHPHYDHCSPEDIAKVSHEKTVIVTEAESAAKLKGDVRLLAPGGRMTIGSVSIEAVAAYNTDKKFHPRAKNWLGFVVTLDGTRIYHAGDTDLIPEMDAIECDVALLPVSGTYVMTAAEAVEAARRIKPKVAIPMHYNTLVGSRADAERFKKGLAGICDVRILPP